ncbi:hypothetical protein FRC06_002230 [Ceratobasidium sp. 370]|nr:hypothetical protein FRC06_002230 [Ceratobasidium sp. 370]
MAGPSNVRDEMDWEPDAGEQPMAEEHSPRRTPRVTLKEVEDEEAHRPCQTPRVTLEEVEDEDVHRLRVDQQNSGAKSPHQAPSATEEEVEGGDAPQAPRLGPHLFARSTRPSLFREPHPDPTTGIPLCFHPVNTMVPPLYTSKLAQPDEFREAYWLDNLPINREAEEEYFRLPR